MIFLFQKKKRGRNSANNGDKDISCLTLKNSGHSYSCVDRFDSSWRLRSFCKEKEGCCVGHVTIYVVAPERNGEITRGTEKRSCRFDSSIDSELKCD